MKKLFIGLLIIAAGTAVYFLVIKKNISPANTIDKGSLIGQWKIDHGAFMKPTDTGHFPPAFDSLMIKYRYHFKKDGLLTIIPDDSSSAPDSSAYAWKDNKLVIHESMHDSTSDIYDVRILNKDSLIISSKDSLLLVFLKLSE